MRRIPILLLALTVGACESYTPTEEEPSDDFTGGLPSLALVDGTQPPEGWAEVLDGIRSVHAEVRELYFVGALPLDDAKTAAAVLEGALGPTFAQDADGARLALLAFQEHVAALEERGTLSREASRPVRPRSTPPTRRYSASSASSDGWRIARIPTRFGRASERASSSTTTLPRMRRTSRSRSPICRGSFPAGAMRTPSPPSSSRGSSERARTYSSQRAA